jgi:tetratricopeptide (TPR) repeat protein
LAIAATRKAIEREPEPINRNILLAQTMLDAGETDAAMVELKKALEIDPEDTRALLVQVYALLVKRDYAQAQQVFESLANPEHDSSPLWYILRHVAKEYYGPFVAAMCTGDVETARAELFRIRAWRPPLPLVPLPLLDQLGLGLWSTPCTAEDL